MHVFGIRHHGPGSARSLLRALRELSPDLVLVEGPPEADALIPFAAHAEMRPPVAMLVYDPAEPRRSVYYPFAVFSPEWQAIRYALDAAVPVRFFDLPLAHQLIPEAEDGDHPPPPGVGSADDGSAGGESADGGSADGGSAEDGSAESVIDRSTSADPVSADGDRSTSADPASADGSASPDAAGDGDRSASAPPSPESADADGGLEPAHVREDPLNWLARAAGEQDGERWWEQLVEHRRGDAGLFEAVLEAMAALRDELRLPEPLRERQREAYMRQQIRAAEREGHQRIAVVCGAWHAPALVRKTAVKDDAALLKGLPKAKLAATWVPWTYGRLAYDSGYGAGVTSPGWYHHLWDCGDDDAQTVSIRWLTRAAQLLRDEDLSASTAQVIDAARLAAGIAALRGRALPGLDELNQAADAVFWGGGAGDGDSLPLRLIHERLVVGERLGAVPADTPAVPLQQDLAREQKRLRLAPEAGERVLELDLRKETDLARSRLLHRLRLLGLPWGHDQRVHGKRGTFHENWRLRWQPEFAVGIIEAAVWGNTVPAAADALTRADADRATGLPPLTGLLDGALLADLPGAARHVIARIDAESARAADLKDLMGALPPLAEVLRYGDVRGTDTGTLAHVVDSLVARVAVGLPLACASLDAHAAAEMGTRIADVHGAVTLLRDERHRELWTGALLRVQDGPGVHGHVRGRAVRLLLELGATDQDGTERRMGLALSPAAGPEAAGAWVDGFLSGSGMVLLHDARLFGLLDGWLAGLGDDAFVQLLPLLRRTFAGFAAGERRGIGELARRGASAASPAAADAEIDRERAVAVLPLMMLLMGVDAPREAA